MSTNTTKVVPGMLVATPDAATHAKESASRIGRALAEAIAARGRATFAISGGNTPGPAYRLLAGDPRIDWKKVELFWVDERAVDPGSSRSNYGHAKAELIDPASIPSGNVHRMMGEATDLAKAALDYEATLKAKVGEASFAPVRQSYVPPSGASPELDAAPEAIPSFDAMVLGIGDDGHTASLFPHGSEIHIRHRLVVAVPAAENREARLTLTAPVIENARAIFVLAMGKSKVEPLEQVWSVEGDLDETPSRLIRNVRGSITWIIDRSAGGMG